MNNRKKFKPRQFKTDSDAVSARLGHGWLRNHCRRRLARVYCTRVAPVAHRAYPAAIAALTVSAAIFPECKVSPKPYGRPPSPRTVGRPFFRGATPRYSSAEYCVLHQPTSPVERHRFGIQAEVHDHSSGNPARRSPALSVLSRSAQCREFVIQGVDAR